MSWTNSQKSNSYLKKSTQRSDTMKKSKPGEEMKSIMSEWHKPIYHKSSFSMSADMVTNTKPKEAEEDNRTMCRICQSMEDSMKNQQVTPCGCAGSLQYVHVNCLRQWRLTQKVKGYDASHCELCKKPYNAQLLGNTDVPTDNVMKLQEDLKKLVRSGIYLMLLVRTWKEELADLHQSQQRAQSRRVENNSHSSDTNANYTPFPASKMREIEEETHRTLQSYGFSTSPQGSNSNTAVIVRPTASTESASTSHNQESGSSGEDDVVNSTREALKRDSEKAALRRRK